MAAEETEADRQRLDDQIASVIPPARTLSQLIVYMGEGFDQAIGAELQTMLAEIENQAIDGAKDVKFEVKLQLKGKRGNDGVYEIVPHLSITVPITKRLRDELRRIVKPPKNFLKGGTPLKEENGRFIIGHSETGHHHVMERGGVEVVEMPAPSAGIRLLRAIVANPNKELVHERPHDTHETLGFSEGAYEIRIGREYDPYEQLSRQQAD